jgi:hypothetical protein
MIYESNLFYVLHFLKRFGGIFGSFDQAKEHILLKSMPFMGLMTFSASPG